MSTTIFKLIEQYQSDLKEIKKIKDNNKKIKKLEFFCLSFHAFIQDNKWEKLLPAENFLSLYNNKRHTYETDETIKNAEALLDYLHKKYKPPKTPIRIARI